MATVFSCAICLEDFTDPRNLDCGHTFCRGCLEEMPLSKKKLRCPICRKETSIRSNRPVASLGKAFLVMQLQQYIKKARKRVCDGCTKKLGSGGYFCIDCRTILCRDCRRRHRRRAGQRFRGHNAKPMKYITFCHTHVNHVQDGKCLDCNVRICQICRLGDHLRHEIVQKRILKKDTDSKGRRHFRKLPGWSSETETSSSSSSDSSDSSSSSSS